LQRHLVHDVAVCGAGPAGAAVACELARRGARVVLFEATRYDGPRFGETLAPQANPLLRQLGVWDAFFAQQHLPSPGTISLWGSATPVENDFITTGYGEGWHVDRNRFDAMLAQRAADAGAEVRMSLRIERCRRDADGSWLLEIAGDVHGRARLLVDASGRNGMRLEADDGRDVYDRLVAIFRRYSYARRAPDLRTIVESAPNGWWYYAPLPGGDALAAFVCDAEHYREGLSLDDELLGDGIVAQRLAGGEPSSRHVVAVSSSRRRRLNGDGWAAAGDAAVSFDPLSGYGLTNALSSALALAEAVAGDSLAAYAAALERRFSAYLEQRAEFYALERRWRERPFWARR
jgi:flavin-dependent dehydrogenase